MGRSHLSKRPRSNPCIGKLLLTGLAVVTFLCVFATAQNQRPIAGRNINMVSGTSWPGGDPFLQRQNEPSLAVSTRNPQHILGGANDYRTVDIPFDPDSGDEKNGDAWLGIFKSADGGNSWTSTLLPGYPQDVSREGLESHIHGYQAAADAVVRAGTNGLFYLSGVAFNRTNQEASIFVARFIDNNNKESGDSISYIDTHVIAKRLNLDKPWIAVDIPRRRDEDKCEIPETRVGNSIVPEQRIPGGTVYLAYSDIDPDASDESKIVIVRSDDCGKEWSEDGIRVTDPKTINQGAAIAIDPHSGTVYVVWRQFSPPAGSKLPARPDAIYIARSRDGGAHFSRPVQIAQITPFDQPSLMQQLPNCTPQNLQDFRCYRSFRTNSYPTMTIDATGRIYVAVTSRVGPKTQNSYESRIVLYTSHDGGETWSPPPKDAVLAVDAVDDKGVLIRGHQFMPSMTFAGGKLMVAYYDSRRDALAPQGGNDTIADPVAYPTLWHNIDVRVAEANPADAPVFFSSQVSRYRVGVFVDPATKKNKAVQLEFNYPNFPMFAQGTTPFMGDYIDLAPAPAFVQKDGEWVYNTDPSASTVYHATWGDNRDVKPPAGPLYDWTNYHPPNPLSGQLQPVSIFDGKTPIQACTPTDPLTGNPINAGMRNQNIYTSSITQGFVVRVPGNSKPLGRIQRGFVVEVKNTDSAQKTFWLSLLNQPAGGQASFLQFQKLTDIWVQVPGHSSIARTVYATSTNARASITVQTAQVTGVNSKTTLPSGTSTDQTFAILNPDILNPDILNPDILNPNIPNPDILNAEVYNPSISNTIENPDILNPDILNPDILNPDILNPDILNPDILNPDILNPDILNPDILNPDILNPDILNASVPNTTTNPNAQVTDLIWTVGNNGNTTSAYSFKTLLSKMPAGLAFQLLIYSIHSTPANASCNLTTQKHQELVVNIQNPDILNPDILNPDILNPDIANATFAVAPGETSKVILRVVNPDTTKFAGVTPKNGNPNDLSAGNIQIGNAALVNTAVAAPAVNTQDVTRGITQPPVATAVLSITSSRSLPLGFTGQPYSFTLMASGNTGSVNWTSPPASGTTGLPPGLNLNPTTGAISGTPTQAGTFSFKIQAQDSTTLMIASDIFSMSVQVPGIPSLAIVTQPDPCPNSIPVAGCARAGTPITPAVSVKAVDGSGKPVVSQNIQISIGTAPAGGALAPSSLTLVPTDGNGIAAFSNLILTAGGTYQLIATAPGSAISFQAVTTLSFNVIPGVAITATSMPDGVLGQPYSAAPSVIGGIPPLTWTEVNSQGLPLPAGQSFLPPGLFLSSSGGISGTPSATGSYNFTLRVMDSVVPQQTDFRTLTIRIANALILQGPTLLDTVTGTPYTHSLNLSGGFPPYTCTAVPPAAGGISFNGGTCSFNGTPSAAGNYPVNVSATDSSSPPQVTASVLFTLRVSDPLKITTGSPLPPGTAGSPYSTNLSTLGGVPPITWNVINGNLPQGLTVVTSGASAGLISGTPAVGSAGTAAFTVQAMDSGLPQAIQQQFQLYVAPFTLPGFNLTRSVGIVQIPLVVQGGTAPFTWTLAGGSLPPGLLLSTRVPQFLGALTGIIGVATTPGTYNFSLSVNDATNATLTQSYTLTIHSFVSTDLGILPDAFVGNPYTYTMTAANNPGPVTWGLAPTSAPLPPGLAINGNQITGSPTVAGTYGFTVSATATSGGVNVTINRNRTLTISAVRVTSNPMLPNATVNSAYSTSLTATGGTPPYTWSANGGLPPGLTMTPAGAISGIPGNSPGTHKFQAVVKDNAGHLYAQSMAMTVLGIPAVLPSIGTTLLNDLTVGAPLSQTIGVSGGTAPYTWSASGLPSGLTLRTGSAAQSYVWPSDVELGGVVPALGDYPFTVSVTDSSVPPITINRAYTLHVSALSNDFPSNGALGALGVPYSFWLRPIGGTGPWNVALTGRTLPAGVTLASAGTTAGLISGTPLESGNFFPRFTITDSSGAVLNRSVFLPVSSAGSGTVSINNFYILPDATLGQFYSFSLSASGAGGFIWTVAQGSTLPQGLTLSSAGVLSGIPTVNGTTSFTIRATDAGNANNYAAAQFTLTVTPLQFLLSTLLPNATVGVPYAVNLPVTGGTPPYTWTLVPGSEFPDGLVLSNALTGTPSANAGGEYFINTLLSDSAGNVRHVNFTLSVYATTTPPLITTFYNLGTRSVGDVQIELDATGNGGPYTWSLVQGSLPPGLALRTDLPSFFSPQASAGIIGVTTSPGAYSFILDVTDLSTNKSTPQLFSLNITSLEPTDRFSLPDAFAGVPYQYAFSATGSNSAVTWTPTSGLPAGMSLSPAGVLSGTPAQAGTYRINFTLNSGATSVGRGVMLLVSAIQITTTGALPGASQGQAYTPVQFAASPPSPNYVWSASALPVGMSFSGSGVLSGTPAFAGNVYFTVSVTNTVTKDSYTKPFALNVVGTPPLLPSLTNIADVFQFTVGTPVSFEFYVSGGTAPYTWKAIGLPAGLNLRSGSNVSSYVHPYNAELWGVSAQTGTYPVTVSVTDSSSPPVTVSQTYNVTFVALDNDFPPSGVRGVPFSFYLRVIGGAGSGYSWSNPPTAWGRLPAGLTLDTVSGVVSGTPLEDGSFNPRFVLSDGTISISRSISFTIANGSGNAATPASISNDGNVQLPAATVYSPYTYTLTAGGAPSFTWTVLNNAPYTSTPPPGMSLTSSGVLSGTPVIPGTYSFFVQAADTSNANNYSIRRFSITVTTLSVSRPLPNGSIGNAYSAAINVSGGTAPYSVKLDTQRLLPPGLSLNNGVISGTPASQGQYYFNLIVSDSSVPSNSVLENFGISIY